MKKKKKKFSSLNGVLALLQQLQVKYYKSNTFGIITLSTGTIVLSVSTTENGAPMSINFDFWDDRDIWETSYQRLLDYLNTNEL